MKSHICILILSMLFFASCQSTSSVLIDDTDKSHPDIAVLTFDGNLGSQAAELITQELAAKGVAVAERSERIANLALDTDRSSGSPKTTRLLKNFGDQLGVDYVLTGTVSTDRGPLYSFAHVFITMRLIDINTDGTKWVGNYGNSLWTSAISTQGDLKRGVRHLTKEFIKSGASDYLRAK